MKAGEIAKFREVCIQAGLKMECGPSDKTRKIPSAGVGMIVQDNITMFKAEKKTEAFNK